MIEYLCKITTNNKSTENSFKAFFGNSCLFLVYIPLEIHGQIVVLMSLGMKYSFQYGFATKIRFVSLYFQGLGILKIQCYNFKNDLHGSKVTSTKAVHSATLASISFP